LIEKYPSLENKIRSYDDRAGCCLLCACLFDTLENIEREKNINFNDLYKSIEGVMADV
jgi:uncharacterized protein (DUF2225 family)